MPPATNIRKRSRAAAALDDQAEAGPSTAAVPRASRPGSSSANRANKVSRIAPPPQPPLPRPPPTRASEFPDFDDLFGDDDDDDSSGDLVDLTAGDKVVQELAVPKVDNSTKLVNFECIICMDSATDLTVTHCGHMFCGQCLHQAMHSEVTKKICPMCRQKLEPRPKNGQLPSKTAKTFFHLELKLKPANSRGKKPAR